MREELEQLLASVRADRDKLMRVDALEIDIAIRCRLNHIADQLDAILAKDAEKPSEGKETQKNGISEQCTALVRDHRIRMAGFAEGYAQGLEAAANFVDEAMHPVTSTANQLRDEAVRVRTEVAK